MRRRVRVHQAELRSRQVLRSLPATGEPNGEPMASYEANSSSLLSLPAAADHRIFSAGAARVAAALAAGAAFPDVLGEGAAAAPSPPCRPGEPILAARRQFPAGMRPRSCSCSTGSYYRIGSGNLPAVAPARRGPMALTERNQQPMNNRCNVRISPITRLGERRARRGAERADRPVRRPGLPASRSPSWHVLRRLGGSCCRRNFARPGSAGRVGDRSGSCAPASGA